ncbi:class I SAM-dependent methyltransferase [Paenibacillus sp. CECT 9249]|uniref:class I SAM-dependent methyltransferase n=1 Tax=unclassified Paenibacillus TaxID=185978 RepID=UPI001C121ACD|nr:class I SAM-dependent methyltransferase [Paenibacillus sp. CECT 9249]MBU5440813.1 class I SAM-dependent methyltransferase [Paenibacillus sp. MSJ-34]CAH0118491.1 Ubiquinone biosynthesis O-methyltransferase, mitochondrial [Paenibacillus sp. CECT 9249]
MGNIAGNERLVRQTISQYNQSQVRIPQSKFRELLNMPHNDAEFTGERLIINDHVKRQFDKVFREHTLRYDFASRFVQGNTVLDAACGVGYGTKMFEIAGAELAIGVDASAETVSYAAMHYAGERAQFMAADIHALPFPNDSFDIVVSFETIEHIPDGAEWIRESARVLKEGGLLIISTPNRSRHSPGIYFGEKPHHTFHLFEYSVNEFVGELLTRYDIVELYGQTFVHDYEWYATRLERASRGLNPEYVPPMMELSYDYSLVPLSRVKNAQPTFVIAVCRKP